MPLCKRYDELSHLEKITFIGELVHAVQNDNALYELGKDIIELAIVKGVFNGVTIMPPNNETDLLNDKN